MKTEMAYLRYRLEVVQAWPESPRKTVFLYAIESRIVRVQRAPMCPKGVTNWHGDNLAAH